MKKLVSMILAMLLLVSLAAYAEGTAWEEAIPCTPYEETIKITTLGTDTVMTNSEISYDENDPKRISANENTWIEAYKKYLNIDVERIIAEDGTALNALVNTMMASGDLPDILLVNRSLFYALVENEVLVDLQQIWDNYQGGQMLYDTYTQDMLDAGKLDGGLYGLAQGVNNYNCSKVLWIRQDWLDKVNMEAPKTWDELCAVARAFIDAGLGGEYTIGIGFNGLNDGPIAAFDVALKTWKEAEDGTYVYENTTERMKTALLAMQKAYADGLFNKDFAVSGGIGEEVANEHCGILYGEGWVGSTDVNNSYVNDTSAVWIGVEVPTLTGERVMQWTNNTVNDFIVVTENCKHPEAVLKLLDLELYLCYGTGDNEANKLYYSYQDPNTNSNIPIWNLRALRNVTYTPMYDLTIARMCREGVKAGATDENMDLVPSYAQVWFKGAYRSRPEITDEEYLANRKAGGNMGFGNGVVWYGYRILEELVQAGWLQGEYPGPRSETMNTYWSSLDEALNSAALEVIMGADISVYDKAVEAWYTGGGQTITEEVTAYYQSIK